MNVTVPAPDLPPAAVRRMHRAVTAQQRHDDATAETLYRELTREYPGFADAWHFYGLLLHRRGEREEALALLAKAEALAPENFGFLLNHGRVLLEYGEAEQAYDRLGRARTLAPEDAPTLKLLVQAARRLGHEPEMLPLLEGQLARRGEDWQLWMALGECREQTGDRKGAMAAFTKAGDFAPRGEINPQLSLGWANLVTGDMDAARTAFEAALGRRPDSGLARVGLANVAAREGDFARSEILARDALARNPRAWSAWLLLAGTRDAATAGALAPELERAAERAGDDPEACLLHFARGQVWEKLGEYERAFAAYALGNRQRGEHMPYSRTAHIDFTREVLAELDEHFVARAGAVGVRGRGPIFVCGMLRSGTTLVETILASHPEVSAGGEMTYIHDRMRQALGPAGLVRSGSWLRGLADAELHALAQDWREVLDRAAAGRARITDKMPGNYTLLGFLHVCFPDCHIVHVHRDPRDTCFSCYANTFETHNFSYALDSVGHYYRLYECLMAHWRRVLPAGRIIDVEYERLVADPEAEIRRLLAALDLPWEPRCLDFHETARVVLTASLHQVRRPLYSSSVGRWRHFERHLAPLLAALADPSPLAPPG